MDKNAALARLGLNGEVDAAEVTRAYGQRLAMVQEQLSSAQSDAERGLHQNTLSGLVEAYEYLTGTGSLARARTDDPGTALRDSSAAPPPASTQDMEVRLDTGSVLSGRLEIGAMLGYGGMGYVYVAHDRLRDEDVAIKVLRQDLISSTAAKERFLAEAKLSSNLSHPNIVRVYDVGESGGHYYLSMERLHGHTLRQRIEDCRRENRTFGLSEVTSIARQLIDALRYAHRYIVHRDLKPENIWLADDGTVKLMDFGIARAFSSSHMTQTGMMMGTAYYMAPEQRLDAKEVDWRADQYALGVVVYELLAGTIPMGAVKPLDQIRGDVPQRYSRAVMRAMAPKREERWPSLEELLSELEAPANKSSKAALWLILGVGIAATAAGGAYYMINSDENSQAAATFPPKTSLAATAGGSQQTPDDPPEGSPPPQDPPNPAEPVAQVPSGPASTVPGVQNASMELEPKIKPSTFQDTASRTNAQRAATAEVSTRAPVPTEAPRVTTASDSPDARRAECIAQCERDNGQCLSISRRGRQDCMRTVGFGAGASGGLTIAPGNQNSACAFFTEDRCKLAPDRDDCLQRTRTRQEQCVTVRSGSFASGVQGCDAAAREGESMCLSQLRDCRTYCN